MSLNIQSQTSRSVYSERVLDEQGVPFLYLDYLNSHECSWSYANWKGDFLDVETVKKGCLKALDNIERFEVTRILNDNRELSGSWDEANEWIATVWMPQAIGLGLRKFAHIVSPDLYAALASEMMADNAEEGVPLQLRLFKEESKALAWLLDD